MLGRLRRRVAVCRTDGRRRPRLRSQDPGTVFPRSLPPTGPVPHRTSPAPGLDEPCRPISLGHIHHLRHLTWAGTTCSLGAAPPPGGPQQEQREVRSRPATIQSAAGFSPAQSRYGFSPNARLLGSRLSHRSAPWRATEYSLRARGQGGFHVQVLIQTADRHALRRRELRPTAPKFNTATLPRTETPY